MMFIPQVHVIVHHVLLMLSYQLLVQLVKQLALEFDHVLVLKQSHQRTVNRIFLGGEMI